MSHSVSRAATTCTRPPDTAVVAVGFFVMLFLPEVPLRTQSGIQAQQSGAGEITGTGTEAEEAAQAAGAAAPTSTAPPVGQPGGDPRR